MIEGGGRLGMVGGGRVVSHLVVVRVWLLEVFVRADRFLWWLRWWVW